MNLLELITDKSTMLINNSTDNGISSVINHIEIAMKHYDVARDGTDYLYNDVVYRCNQAYEGALKEAYRVIAKKDHKRKTPNQIEKYFEESSVLKERVLALLKNYRQEWRNISTHDYQIVFADQEAFLAIVSISAFTNILFDQMLYTKAFDDEIDILKINDVMPKVNSSRTLVENIVNSLERYRFKKFLSINGSMMEIRSIQIHGSLYAYLSQLKDDISVIDDYKIIEHDELKNSYNVDFLITKGNEKCIVEVKNTRNASIDMEDSGKKQLMKYLTVSGIQTGILYLADTESEKYYTVQEKIIIGDVEYNLYVVKAIE